MNRKPTPDEREDLTYLDHGSRWRLPIMIALTIAALFIHPGLALFCGTLSLIVWGIGAYAARRRAQLTGRS